MIPELRNKSSFKELYHQYHGILFNYAYSKTQDYELCKEIVQNTFVKIWTRRGKTEFSGSLKSYLFVMVRNAIIDHFRKNKKMVSLDIIASTSNKDTDVINREEKAALFKHMLKKALAEMKPKRRMIFELSKFERLTHAEIAIHLNISERTVEDNIAKALNQVREMLKPYKNDFF